MINKAIKSIDKNVLDSFVLNGVREDRMLDYKEILPANGREDRKEFLADVTAFANGAGGYIVYGVTEKRENNRPTGIPEMINGLADINADAEVLRLENMLRDGIEPRINGIQIQPVNGFARGPVIVVRIPKSWSSPHMVKAGESRFYSRNNAGKYPLDVAEIRSAFALSEALPERVRRFREERIARIVAGETPLPLPSGHAKVVLHLLPIDAMDSMTRLDMTPFRENPPPELRPIYAGDWNNRNNFDGLLVYGGNGDSIIHTPTTYVQIFRSGAIEAVESLLMESNNIHERSVGCVPQNMIGAQHIEKEVIAALTRFLKLEQSLGMQPPIFVMLSLIGVKGYGIYGEYAHSGGSREKFDRDTLLLPDAVMESYEDLATKHLKPAFDAMWQSAGYDCCPRYKGQ